VQVREKIILSTLEGRRSREVSALFDTGTKFTYISGGIGKELVFTPYKAPREVQLAVKGGRGRVLGEISLIFEVDGCEMPLPIQVYVVEDLAEEAIIGTNFMKGFEIELDLKEGRAKLKRYPPEVRLI